MRRGEARFSDSELQLAYKAYSAGFTVRQIADQVWEEGGFVSSSACTNRLRQQFLENNLKLRPPGRQPRRPTKGNNRCT